MTGRTMSRIEIMLGNRSLGQHRWGFLLRREGPAETAGFLRRAAIRVILPEPIIG